MLQFFLESEIVEFFRYLHPVTVAPTRLYLESPHLYKLEQFHFCFLFRRFRAENTRELETFLAASGTSL